MALFFTLTLAIISFYLRFKLNEEIESLAASIIACLGAFLSLIFAPLLLKLFLLIILLVNPQRLLKLNKLMCL